MRHLLYVSQLYSIDILRPLQSVILERGEEARWFFVDLSATKRLNPGELLLGSVEEVIAYNPDYVYVPGNTVPHFFPGCKVQIFHGLATDKMGKAGHYRIRGFFDLYCTHGPEGTSRFAALQQHDPHFRVVETGWPKLDPLFHHNAPGKARAELDIGGEEKVILYAPTFSPSLTSAKALYPVIRDLVETRPWFWFVKFHPKMDREIIALYRELSGPRLQYFEIGTDVLPLMHAADLMVSDNSSIAVEFLMLEKPLITFRSQDPGEQQVDIISPEQLPLAIDSVFKNSRDHATAARAFVDRFHPYRDGRSSERVLDAAAQFVMEGGVGLCPKPLNLFRKFKIRLKYRYWR